MFFSIINFSPSLCKCKKDFGENGYQSLNRIQSWANPDGFIEKKRRSGVITFCLFWLIDLNNLKNARVSIRGLFLWIGNKSQGGNL
jgi:hypothetical protein